VENPVSVDSSVEDLLEELVLGSRGMIFWAVIKGILAREHGEQEREERVYGKQMREWANLLRFLSFKKFS
ncbi:11428_t:CDS:1, partial [Dentiscutata erythropus]